MTKLAVSELNESLSRLVKLDIDLGRAATVEEAYQTFAQYRATIVLSDSAAHSAEHQSCLLTLLVLASKCFLGGISICGELNVPLLTPLPYGTTLRDAVTFLGARVVPSIHPSNPIVVLGDIPTRMLPPRAIRCTFEGWRGGIVPVASNQPLPETSAIGPAITLSAALAINEIFTMLRGESAEAGYRSVGASLWNVEATNDWLHSSSDGPALRMLPSGVWLAGLGHLGQAYAWNLCLLPYAKPKDFLLVLQDFDRVTKATTSTGMIAMASSVEQRKTRMVSRFLMRRGYETRLVERRFAENLTISDDEPRILMAGFDNAMARQHLEAPGFSLVIDAGLGHGGDDFQAMRLHRFPARRRAAEIWSRSRPEAPPKTNLPAYANLGTRGLDQCGVTLLAERAVGAPFVGCTAAAIAVSEILRELHGGPCYSVIDLHLRAPDNWVAAAGERDDTVNPGITRNVICCKAPQ